MPDFFYRIVSKAEWETAQTTGFVPKRDIDIQDGYYHLSTRQQCLATADKHFAGQHDLLALRVRRDDIDVTWELAPKRGEEFPHLYADFPVGLVQDTVPLIPGDKGFTF